MLSKMKSVIRSKKAEGDYIELCISLVCILFVVVLTINIYSFYTLKDNMNEIAEGLSEYASMNGSVGVDFDEEVARMQQKYPKIPFTVDCTGTQLHNQQTRIINRGDTIVVKVTTYHALNGLGLIGDINIPCSVIKTSTCIGQFYQEKDKG